jgi:hypothetical protein
MKWMKAASSLLVLPLLITQSYAGSPGTTTAELLKIPIGTRAVGMGEAFTALANDSSALYWNPAGLSLMNQKEATFMHSDLMESVHYEHLAYAAPMDNFAVAGNFSYLGYGDIAGYDNSGVDIGNVSAYSYQLNGGLSRLFGPLALGVSGGLIHQTLADDSANTFSANLGALYTLNAHPWKADYRFGLAVQNLGPGLKFVNESAPLPRKIKLGAAVEGLEQLPLNLTADVTLPNDNDAYLSLGSEYWFRDILALRLGYAGSNDEGRGLRAGIGIKYGGLLLDYAYAGMGDFGTANRINFTMRFGEKVRQLNAGERKILKEAKAAEKDGAYVMAIGSYDELLDKDPANDHILHYMINAYDRMAHAEMKTNVVEKSVPIPSPEDAAMAELVPEGDNAPDATYAQAVGLTAPVGLGVSGADPLGLDKLPEVGTMDKNLTAAQVTPKPETVAAPAKAVVETPKAVPEPEDLVKKTSPAIPASSNSANYDAPALTPADIYGN